MRYRRNQLSIMAHRGPFPWYFREYGKVIVHEMFMKHETFMHSRAKLRYPTKEDREKYESLEFKSPIELLDTKGYV